MIGTIIKSSSLLNLEHRKVCWSELRQDLFLLFSTKKPFKNGFRHFKVILFRPKHFVPLNNIRALVFQKRPRTLKICWKKSKEEEEEEEDDCKKRQKLVSFFSSSSSNLQRHQQFLNELEGIALCRKSQRMKILYFMFCKENASWQKVFHSLCWG